MCLTFRLGNVLRSTTACTFSTSQLLKVIWTWCVLYILTSALRATTACNFSSLIWPAGSAPVALVSLLFDPPEPQIIGRTQCVAAFLPFRAPASLSSDSFSFLIFFSSLLWLFPPLLFHLSILSEVWLLNFLRQIYKYIMLPYTTLLAIHYTNYIPTAATATATTTTTKQK